MLLFQAPQHRHISYVAAFLNAEWRTINLHFLILLMRLLPYSMFFDLYLLNDVQPCRSWHLWRTMQDMLTCALAVKGTSNASTSFCCHFLMVKYCIFIVCFADFATQLPKPFYKLATLSKHDVSICMVEFYSYADYFKDNHDLGRFYLQIIGTMAVY